MTTRDYDLNKLKDNTINVYKNNVEAYDLYTNCTASELKKLNTDAWLLLNDLGNYKYITEIRRKYKNVIIIDSKFQELEHKDVHNINDAVKFLIKETKGMKNKFDLTIENPPYDGKLHLEILEKAIPVSDKVVNISPDLWMKRRGSSEVKRFGNSVGKHIISAEYISPEEAHRIFKNTESFMSLSILVCDNNEHDFDYKNYWKRFYTESELSILDKITIKGHMLSDVKFFNDLNTNYCVLIANIAGGRGNLPIYKYNGIVAECKDAITGEDWLEAWNSNPKHKQWQKSNYEYKHIRFDTLEEAINYYNSYSTKFMKWVCQKTVQQQHIKLNYIPYMGDYTKPWDDKRFCEYFGITSYIDDNHAEPNSEWEIILNTMKEYA